MRLNKFAILAFIPFLLVGCGGSSVSSDSSTVIEPFELVSVDLPTSFSHYFETASFKFKKGDVTVEAMIDIPIDEKLLCRDFSDFCWTNKRAVMEQKMHEIDGYDQLAVYEADFIPSLEYISKCIEYTDIRFTKREFDDMKNQIKQYFENEDTKYTRRSDYNGLVYGEFDIISQEMIYKDDEYEMTVIKAENIKGTLYSSQRYIINANSNDFYSRTACFSEKKGQFKVNGIAVDSVSPDTTGEITFEIKCPDLTGKSYIDFRRYFVSDIECSLQLPKVGEKLKKLYLSGYHISNSATMYKFGSKTLTFTGDPEDDPDTKLTEEMIAQGLRVEFCIDPAFAYIIPCAKNSNNEFEPTISCVVNDYKMFGRTAVYGGELYYYFWGTYSGLTY